MALCGGIVLEEALDLSFDRLLMMMMYLFQPIVFELRIIIIFSEPNYTRNIPTIRITILTHATDLNE